MIKPFLRHQMFFLLIVWIGTASCASENVMPSETIRIQPSQTNGPIVIIPTGTESSTLTPTETMQPTVTQTPTIYPTTIIPSLTPDLATHTQIVSDEPRLHASFGRGGDYGAPGGVSAFSPDNRYVVVAQQKVFVFDIENNQVIFEFDIPNENYFANDAVFNSDASVLAVTFTCLQTRSECLDLNVQSHLMMWELEDGKLLCDLLLPRAFMEGPYYDYYIPVYGLAFHPDDKNLLAFTSGNLVQVVNVFNVDEPLVEIDLGKEMYGTEVSFSENGQYLNVMMEWDQNQDFASNWSYKFRVQVWDTGSRYVLRRDIDFPEKDGYVEDMSLSGSYLALSDEITGVYTSTNLITQEVRYFPYRKGRGFVSPDRNLVAFSRSGYGFEENEQGVEIWDTDTWRLLYQIQSAYARSGVSISFSSDNKWMAIVHQGQVFLWDISSLQ